MPSNDRNTRREEYLAKLRDPRWQKMRLQVFERDKFACQMCFDTESTLHVHHRYYEAGKEPWDYPMEALVTLCESCHESETELRPGEERLLLETLRKRPLYASDLLEIATAFAFMEFRHLPEVVVTALSWTLRDPAAQDALLDRYFAHLAAKHSARTARIEELEQDATTAGQSAPPHPVSKDRRTQNPP
jgi:hypothetical protein